MPKNKNLIAYCGLYCGDCLFYKGEIADLARMTENRFEEIKKELDVKKRVDNLDHRIFRIEQALNIASK